MQPSERIKTINELNAIGIQLARMPTLEQAFKIHEIAAHLAVSSDINPDYWCVSAANQAYASRQMGGHKGFLQAINILDDTFNRTEPRGLSRTFAGRGRIYEELGIVTADFPLLVPDAAIKIGKIKEGLLFFEKAIRDYGQALENQGEIYTPEQLTQRRLRTIGMRAPKAIGLSELVGDEREKGEWIDKAVGYATEEVQEREKLGETSGQFLANAYHTLGVALTETVLFSPENYGRAKEMLGKAAGVPGIHPNTLITLELRRAWLEYRRDPSAQDAIGLFFGAFLADMSALTGADKNALNRKVQELGKHLGGDYVKRVEGFYGG